MEGHDVHVIQAFVKNGKLKRWVLSINDNNIDFTSSSTKGLWRVEYVYNIDKLQLHTTVSFNLLKPKYVLVNSANIDSENDLFSVWRQAIIWS